MKQKALQQSLVALGRADNALTQMRFAEHNRAFVEAWDDFLQQVSRINEKLKAGSRDDPQSKKWYEKLAKTRQEDKLLQYLHQARNAEHHGLENSIDEGFGIWAYGKGEFSGFVDGNGKFHVTEFKPETPGAEIEVKYSQNLKKVVNRGVSYELPASHLGKPLDDVSPIALAELAIVYYRGVLHEAKSLVR
ncbi:hypothetical protein [Thetidibacter halocola]|uniref:Uncharacterized protein n=1 Tax=Thetidibacter halocola TaxID=2827239 RepID=A0A8J7WKX3_9RHOB|nr:hypothetical protein [Thetidibacter halocola]MBS0126894.1 hypothetical protein [Thetidibacter halocola]